MAMFKRATQRDSEQELEKLLSVLKAFQAGEYSQHMPTDRTGMYGEIATTLNETMMMLSTVVSEVSRVSRETGTEGKLGVQMNVPTVMGIWKDLTETVNSIANTRTVVMHDFGKIATAIAQGDLSQRVTADVKGEVLLIKNAINAMADQLSTITSEVTRVARDVGTEGKLGGQADAPGAVGAWKELTENVNIVLSNFTSQVRAIAGMVTAVSGGDPEEAFTAFTNMVAPSNVAPKGEVGEVQKSFGAMVRTLRVSSKQKLEDEWLKTSLATFSRVLQDQHNLTTLSETVLSELATLLNFQHGVFYVMNESTSGELRLKMLCSYAYKQGENIPQEWRMGEGLVGQCAVERKRILVTDVPDDYIQIASGLGAAKPLNILVLPITFENKVKAVIELASFTQFSVTQLAFLDQFAEPLGIGINTIEISVRTEELLKQSQTLTEELQSQQEELRETNQELEEKAQLLEEQKLEVEVKNREVEQAKSAVEEKASQLEITSKYKSEFLSNMSHELRTPLNSLLILAEHLAANPKSHLDPKEVEFAKLIHVSGNDLLLLINEILDLSKIESGTVLVDEVSVPFAVVQEQIENTFRHVAKDRGLGFEITFAHDLPPVIVTDDMRLLQVMKNLLANAFKFTEKGKVSVRVNRALSGWSVENQSLNGADTVIAFTVEDTGIGISADKQRIIFEAFQQGDGRTARKYGGTGLGLSISREIARLLGGELKLASSTPQQGSTFVLYVPQNRVASEILGTTLESDQRSREEHPSDFVRARTSYERLSAMHESEIVDDRAAIQDGDRVLLIIEDDPTFVKIILDLAREKGFKGIVAMRGLQAMELARHYTPDAITLDIHIPEIDGWTILETLKRDPNLRHIPVNIITVEESPLRALSQGAFKYLIKPVSRVQLGAAIDATRAFLDRPVKNLLLVTADKKEREQITDLLGDDDITIANAVSGKAGLDTLGQRSFDCVVIGAKLPDMSSTDFVTAVCNDKSSQEIPVVVFNGVSISDSDRDEIEKLGTASVVRCAESPDHLLYQTALFLHRVVSRLPEEKRKLLQHYQQSSNNLSGKKVLIVDDDTRNIIALTVALEHRGLIVSSAENGYNALNFLKQTTDVDLVLMDIMMPEMDGYETMRAIRKLAKFKKLPIIALTAKAMVGDREKCLEAGASDYLSKPVNIEQLSSLMQVWLSK